MRVRESNRVVTIEPAEEKTDCTAGLRGMLSGYPEMAVDKFLERKKADEVMAEVKACPITIFSEISDELFEEAGRFKASYKVSFADTFALATASVTNATLLTTDHHEMDAVEQGEQGIKFHWVR
ncbi:MAG: PIN domain-containing protein [Oscillospiraceae bacterium]|nr:PIN domain-containing protein [Oscillospiraceae bacterium]